MDRLKKNHEDNLYSSTFHTRNSIIYGATFHIISILGLEVCTVILLSNPNRNIILILLMVFFCFGLYSSILFMCLGASINKKINKISGQNLRWSSDFRIKIIHRDFEITGLKEALSSQEKFHILLHQRLQKIFLLEEVVWTVLYLFYPAFFFPGLVSKITSGFLNSDDESYSLKNINEVFENCKLKAEQRMSSDFNNEPEDVKEALLSLIILYFLLKRGYVVNKKRLEGTKLYEFVDDLGLQKINFLYLGEKRGAGNIGQVIEKIFATTKSVVFKKYVCQLMEIFLCIEYFGKGKSALIKSKNADNSMAFLLNVGKIGLICAILIIIEGLRVKTNSYIYLGITLFFLINIYMLAMKIDLAPPHNTLLKKGLNTIIMMKIPGKYKNIIFNKIKISLNDKESLPGLEALALEALIKLATNEQEFSLIFLYIEKKISELQNKFKGNLLLTEVIKCGSDKEFLKNGKIKDLYIDFLKNIVNLYRKDENISNKCYENIQKTLKDLEK